MELHRILVQIQYHKLSPIICMPTYTCAYKTIQRSSRVNKSFRLSARCREWVQKMVLLFAQMDKSSSFFCIRRQDMGHNKHYVELLRRIVRGCAGTEYPFQGWSNQVSPSSWEKNCSTLRLEWIIKNYMVNLWWHKRCSIILFASSLNFQEVLNIL